MFDSLWLDVRQAVRRFRRAPVFTLVVIATLALAIGANTTVFSLINAAYLRKVATNDPDRIVAVSTTDTRTGQNGYVYRPGFDVIREQRHLFSGSSMYSGLVLRIEARSFARDVSVEGVMPEYFDLLGVRPLAGRFFAESDGLGPEGATPAVISELFWRRRFGGDLRAIGETMKADGKSVTIVGVAAPGFFGLQIDNATDLFLPVAFVRSLGSDPKGTLRAPYVVARLAPDVTLAQAQAELVGRWPAIQEATAASLPANLRGSTESQRVSVEPLGNGFSGLRRQYGYSFLVLMGLTTLLLAIGCVNVIGLMSARALARHQEVAICRAIGAGRGRVLQQMVVEGLLLTMAGLAAGLLLAWWAGQVITSLLSFARTIEFQLGLTPDARVVAVAVATALVMGIVFGLVPAWHATRPPMADALRHGRAIGRTLGRSGRVVLVAQVALSMMLLVGAGLFAGMLSTLRANVAQVNGRDIVWTRLGRNPGDRAPLGTSYYRRLLEELSAIQGVQSAVLSLNYPAYLSFRGAMPTNTYAALDSRSASSATGLTESVSPGFFETFGIARLRGRDFALNDDDQAPRVAIVSATLARTLFPDGDAVGRRMRITSGPANTEVEIVGVVADAPIFSIRDPYLAVAYRPILQDLARAQFAMAHVRVNGNVQATREAYVRAVESQGHHFVRVVFTFDDWVDYALLQERLVTGVAVSAATLAVLLACLGIYGLMAYSVTVRIREIGVRMALGATREAVVKMITREGAIVVVTGVVIGITGALGAAGLLRSQLYGVSPTDPATIAGAAAAFVLTGIVAAVLPAWRASRIDPIDALRQE